MILLMCDGSSKGNPGVAKAGIVIWQRTQANKKRLTPVKKLGIDLGIATNNEAEWKAVLNGLMEVVTSPLLSKEKEIYIYTDSQLVCNQINGSFKVKDERMKGFKKLYEEYTVGLNVKIQWIPRQLTVLADREAR